MPRQIGERVGAISTYSNGKMVLFGYGTYEGEHVPETDDIKFFGFSLKQINQPNPRIKLDSGEIVWGCECWWGSEEEIKEMEAQATEVTTISITEERAKDNQPEKEETA